MADFNDILNMMNELYKAKPPKAPQQTAQATPSLMPQTPPPVYNVPPGTEGIVPGINKAPTGMPPMPPIPQTGLGGQPIQGYMSQGQGFEPSIQPPPIPQQQTPLGGPDINAPYRTSNALATLAQAIAPNSMGGRLGEGVLGMNQQEIKNQEVSSAIAQRGEAMRSMAEYRRSLAEERQAKLRGQQQTEQMIQGLQTPSPAEMQRGRLGIAAPIPPQSPLEQYYPNPIERAAVVDALRKGTGLGPLLKPGGETVQVPGPSGKPINIPSTEWFKSTVGAKEPSTIREFEDAKAKGYIPQDMKYEDFKTMSAEKYGEKRIQMVLQQPVPTYNTKTHQVEYLTKEEINAAPKGQYAPAELGAKYAMKDATFREIQGSSEIARNALMNLKGDFTPTQRAQFAKVLAAPDERAALDNFLKGTVGTTLSPDQVEYVTSIINLRESAFALRSISGMGQGSDMLREAIAAAVPGATTWSKDQAFKALDKFDNQVDILWSGIPTNLTRRGQPAQTTVPGKTPTGKLPQGRIAVMGPDGKKYSLPKEQLPEAIKQGYKQVQ